MQPTPLLRIPGDLASSAGSKLLEVGGLCFGEYHQTVRQKPRNVFVAEHTLIFVVKGAKVFRFPEHEFVVEAGRALFLRRGCYLLCESVEQGDAYESISLFFNESVLREFWLSLDLGESPVREDAPNMVVLETSAELRDFRDAIIGGLSGKDTLDEEAMVAQLRNLLVLLLKTPHRAELESFFGQLYTSDLPDPVFMVKRNLLAPLSLGDYAQLSCRSLSKFKRDFREQAGESPGKWITMHRLEQARLLAESTKLTVGEICARSGFNNLSHFIRSYKSSFGKTPGMGDG